jgi:hypothetical protein
MMISCGTCTLPQTCGGGGTPTQCGCTPNTPTQACGARICGEVSNGCGGTHTCGTCTPPDVCGPDGTCAPPPP